MSRKFSELPRATRVWVVAGGVLIVAGLLGLLGSYAIWWRAIARLLSSVTAFLLPLALLCLGIYLIWGMRNGRFAGLVDAEGSLRGNGPLLRRAADTRIAGVCGAIARYFSIDAVAVRIIMLLLFVMMPLPTLLLYAIIAIAAPHD